MEVEYLIKLRRTGYVWDETSREATIEIGSYAIEDFIYEELEPLLGQEEWKNFKVSVGDRMPWSASLKVVCEKTVADKIATLPKVFAMYPKC